MGIKVHAKLIIPYKLSKFSHCPVTFLSTTCMPKFLMYGFHLVIVLNTERTT